MSLNKVTPGNNVPESFNVVVEIPMDSDPIKYEVDKDSGAIFVDRFMTTAVSAQTPAPKNLKPNCHKKTCWHRCKQVFQTLR